MPKASTKWIVTVVAFAGLGTAILSFGDTALRMFKTNDDAAPPAAAETINLQVSGTEHVVTHQSGTDNPLQGTDSFIITNEHIAAPAGGIVEEVTSDPGIRPWTHCVPYTLRIHNATDGYVRVRIGEFRTDSFGDIAIGPGERYAVEISDPATNMVTDPESRWYELFPLERCPAD